MAGRSPRLVSVPLAGMAEDFRARLAEQGFSPGVARKHVRLMADLSEWLGSRGLGSCALTEAVAREFGDARRREGRDLWSRQGLAPLLGFLRGCGAAPSAEGGPAQSPSSPAGTLLAAFERYLMTERGRPKSR